MSRTMFSLLPKESLRFFAGDFPLVRHPKDFIGLAVFDFKKT